MKTACIVIFLLISSVTWGQTCKPDGDVDCAKLMHGPFAPSNGILYDPQYTIGTVPTSDAYVLQEPPAVTFSESLDHGTYTATFQDEGDKWRCYISSLHETDPHNILYDDTDAVTIICVKPHNIAKTIPDKPAKRRKGTSVESSCPQDEHRVVVDVANNPSGACAGTAIDDCMQHHFIDVCEKDKP